MPILRSLTGLFRRFRSLVLGREVEIMGQCRMCGNCCTDILLSDGGWIKRRRQFEKLCEDDPGHKRFEIMGRDHLGRLVFRCTLQTPEGVCPCYEDRLPLCRSYPAKSIYYGGGRLDSRCGFSFRDVTFREVLTGKKPLRRPRFDKLLDREISRDDF